MMSALALPDIAVATGGRLVCGSDEVCSNSNSILCENICTDTRSLRKGDLFVALSGENFNGNHFVEQAANSGAVAAVVSEDVDAKLPCVVVEDTRLALGLIAQMNRKQFLAPVIALTGSAGKTTCKEMIASILSESGSVLSTKGNLNNEIGVPLTLLSLKPEHQYAVIEMGACRIGDIRYLAEFTQADIALVTNVMPAHTASFGSEQAIAQTKGEIFESLSGNGTAVINLDDDFSEQWRLQAAGRKVIGFSKTNSDADIHARNIQQRSNGGTHFTLCSPIGDIDVSLTLLGEHNVSNALAAAAVAIAAGADLGQVKNGLSATAAVDGRLKSMAVNGLTIIDDSYNASPGSVKAAIDVLAAFPAKRCLLLGTMGELGVNAEAMHCEVADYAREKGIEQLIVVGEFAASMARVFGLGASSFDQLESCLAVLTERIHADVVLVKGSRFMRMESAIGVLSGTSKPQSSKELLFKSKEPKNKEPKHQVSKNKRGES